LLLVLPVALLLLTPTAVSANGQDVANDISREMISPYCPGITLHDCPSDASHDLRRRITGWAESGMSKDQIWQRLESEFGPDIRATPSTDGSGLWAWVLPIAASVAGLTGAALLAIRWSRARRSDPGPEVEVTPEQRRRLDTELAALRDPRG
jgi:cytochrome c-type biogenesis protein CcmH/NrfF